MPNSNSVQKDNDNTPPNHKIGHAWAGGFGTFGTVLILSSLLRHDVAGAAELGGGIASLIATGYFELGIFQMKRKEKKSQQ